MYDEIKIFEGNRIRSIWNEEKEDEYSGLFYTIVPARGYR